MVARNQPQRLLKLLLGGFPFAPLYLAFSLLHVLAKPVPALVQLGEPLVLALRALGGIDQGMDVMALLTRDGLLRLGTARVVAARAGLGDLGPVRQTVRLDLIALVGNVFLARPVTLLAGGSGGDVSGDAP